MSIQFSGRKMFDNHQAYEAACDRQEIPGSVIDHVKTTFTDGDDRVFILYNDENGDHADTYKKLTDDEARPGIIDIMYPFIRSLVDSEAPLNSSTELQVLKDDVNVVCDVMGQNPLFEKKNSGNAQAGSSSLLERLKARLIG